MMLRLNSMGPKPVIPFPGKTGDNLSQLNIKLVGSLWLKTDYEVRVAATRQLGNNEHWSSDGLYRHLEVLKNLVPKNDALLHAWIESFFFRASAMVPPGEQLVLNLEERVPATSDKCSGGHVDYTAVRTSTSNAEKFLSKPSLSLIQDKDRIFFVSEAKADNIPLQEQIPRAVCEMYLRAKKLKKLVIRGTVTDGCSWIFLVLKMNHDGDGAIYTQMEEPISILVGAPFLRRPELSQLVCDVVAGIISHWVEHSDTDIGEDDWFKREWDFEQDGATTPSPS